MKKFAFVLLVLSTLVALGCDGRAEARSPHQDSTAPAAARVVDSILPPGEALRRFQAPLTPVTALSDSLGSRDMLIARFVTAIERRDEAALKSLLVSKDEYAFLYFPTSAYTRKPYELPPEIAWLLNDQNSRKGLRRLTLRLGGKRLAFREYECGLSVAEGENRFWRSCDMSYSDPSTGRPVTRKLFGAIIERRGRYKFLSYANDF